MSVDFMILGDPEGAQPVGRLDVVLTRAHDRLGIDLRKPEVEIGGTRLAVSLVVEGDDVACIHVTPHDDGFEAALEVLADGLGAMVFDSQTGLALHSEPPRLPDRVDDCYEIELMARLGEDLGPKYEIWALLAASLDVSRANAEGSGEGWRVRVAFRTRNDLVYGVRLKATWTDVAARDDFLARVGDAANQSGWVPFDWNRNDTIGS